MADFVGSTACPWCSLGMPRHPPSPGSKGRADRPARQQEGQDHDRGQCELCRQPHRRPRAQAHRERYCPRHVPVAVSGRREQEASFFTVIACRDQAEPSAGDGDHDQGDAQRRAVVSSTSDPTSRTRVACSRSAPSSKATIALVRSFSTNSRPALRPANDTTLTGEPASPIPRRSTLTRWRSRRSPTVASGHASSCSA